MRKLLTHYLLDPKVVTELPPRATRLGMIEHLSDGLSMSKIDTILDRHIVRLLNVLEKGFRLQGDPFWLGRVR